MNAKQTIESGKAILGIEFGSTRIKAVLIDQDNNPIAQGSHEWENQLVDGLWTYSVEAIWYGLQDCYADLRTNVKKEYDTDIETMTGFLDGIDDSLTLSNNLDNVTEDSVVNLGYDKEKLYMNMVSCNAEWLYTLPQWDAIFTKDEQKELYREEKSSHTVVKPAKVGRNDPCPCGSGKKYKKCCGANA